MSIRPSAIPCAAKALGRQLRLCFRRELFREIYRHSEVAGHFPVRARTAVTESRT